MTVTNSNFIDTSDLIETVDKSYVKDTILLKVMRIFEPRQTSKGTSFQKILVGDDKSTLNVTFWRENVNWVGNLFEENEVYAIKQFPIDDFPKNRDPEKPKDIVYIKDKTDVKKLDFKDVSNGRQPQNMKRGISNQ